MLLNGKNRAMQTEQKIALRFYTDLLVDQKFCLNIFFSFLEKRKKKEKHYKLFKPECTYEHEHLFLLVRSGTERPHLKLHFNHFSNMEILNARFKILNQKIRDSSLNY